MAISRDPTRTAGVERRWNREISLRWGEFKRVVAKKLRTSGQVTNAFDMDAEQIRVFMAFWSAQVEALLRGTTEPPNWQAKFQIQSYQRSLERGRAQLRAQGARITPTPDELIRAATLDVDFTVTPALFIEFAGAEVAAAPIHQETLEFLATRSYESLKGWTDKMTLEVRQILTDGVREGKGINELRKEIVSRLDVSESRARTIARTETIQAYQRGAVNQAVLLGEETGESVNLRWLTAGDGRVRHLHAGWHGEVMTPDELFKNINISPWNCRCSPAPVIEEGDTSEKQARFDKERDVLLAAERAA